MVRYIKHHKDKVNWEKRLDYIFLFMSMSRWVGQRGDYESPMELLNKPVFCSFLYLYLVLGAQCLGHGMHLIITMVNKQISRTGFKNKSKPASQVEKCKHSEYAIPSTEKCHV